MSTINWALHICTVRYLELFLEDPLAALRLAGYTHTCAYRQPLYRGSPKPIPPALAGLRDSGSSPERLVLLALLVPGAFTWWPSPETRDGTWATPCCTATVWNWSTPTVARAEAISGGKAGWCGRRLADTEQLTRPGRGAPGAVSGASVRKAGMDHR
ncbi:hypothetical protein FQ154_06645 [Paeniglutamicibacter gangotriensis]|uniref:Uncharacterized protein n=1 Tax=Paeniglutamicibacter gangotriensis TaxID=254787 RepID=A0A5B0EJM1_9MICC|nr:hypothetical protein FQ154_06645 [Paeniglutamicibacter gangotriensis]